MRFSNYRPLPDGMVGHPRGVGWFCRRHLRGARALARGPMGRAVGALRRRSIVWRAAVAVLLVAALAAAISSFW